MEALSGQLHTWFGREGVSGWSHPKDDCCSVNQGGAGGCIEEGESLGPGGNTVSSPRRRWCGPRTTGLGIWLKVETIGYTYEGEKCLGGRCGQEDDLAG